MTEAPQMVSGYGQFHTDEDGATKRTPYTSITWAGVQALVDNPQQVLKGEAQWLIPSTLPTRRFLRQEGEGEFWMLWADLDTEPRGAAAVETALAMHCIGSVQVEVYSSRSATAEVPKCRALVPLGKPLTGAEWVLAQQVLNDLLEGAGMTPDRVSERTGQLCYLPNRGAFYEVNSRRTGKLFDPLTAWADKLAAKRQAMADKAASLEAARKAAAEARAARAAQPGGTGGRSLIDAFNAAYHVAEILRQAGYAERGDTFCHPASESGSYSARVKDGRVHSLSSGDPLYTDGGGIGAHDAFSAFEVLMHNGDRDAALKDAGDRWLTIGGESWNTVTRREWAQQQTGPADQGQPLPRADDDGVIEPALFAVVPFADLTHTEPPPPSYWWDGYLPAGVVTLLGAHGGTGKSMLALMLAVCITLGLPLFGIPTKRGRVAFFSGEDGAELVRYRLRWICLKLGVDIAALQDRLHILDATGGEPALFHEVTHKGSRQGLTTPSYAALRGYIDAHGIDVLLVDNASDAFDASEIDRSRVRGFMRALARIAQARAGAVMLLAHVDKGTSRGDRQGTESYSGSTAWHNSARSRLYLSRDKDGSLLLEHQKLNVGKMVEPLRLSWPEGGIPQAEQAFGPVVQGIADRVDLKALVTLIHAFFGRGEFIATDTRSRYHACKVLADEPTFPKRRKPAEVFGMLRDAEFRKLIERETYKDRNRKEHERWALTAAGCELIGVPTPSAPCAPSTEHSAPDHTAQQGAPCAPCGVQGVRGGRSARNGC